MATLAEIIDGGTPLVIPVPSGAYSTQRIALDGRVYTLRFAWNTHAEAWFMMISDATDTTIIDGVRVLPNWPLLRMYRYDPRLPPGEIIAHDLTDDGSPPGLDELGIGKRVELTYYAQAQTR